MKRTISCIFISILLAAATMVQGKTYADTLGLERKNFGLAAGELVFVQLLPWSFNRFARKAEFAKISFSSVGANLKPSSWEWDDNKFNTNQFAHPYHGNLYFNTFRSNGYSFWQSAPAAFAGSFLWEVAGETHKPAPNDFINTGLGGIALGEITYRIANRIIDPRAIGVERQCQEVLALIINPTNGLNRIIKGKWGRVYGTQDTAHTFDVIFDIGARRYNTHSLQKYVNGGTELYLGLRVQYGNKFALSNTAFDNFNLLFETGSDDSTYMNTIQVNGALKTWEMRETSNQIHLYSVTMNYDYFKNTAFEYGAQSFNFKLLSNWTRKSKAKVYTEIGGGFIALAAVPDKYLYYGEGRNYDYGPGISVSTQVNINFNNVIEGELVYKGARTQTVDGNKSSFILNTLSAEVRARIWRRCSISASAGQFTLNGYYSGYKNVSELYPFARFSVGYKI